MLSVIICPISSGDTAYRSARLTLADWFRLNQSSVRNRLLLSIPLLLTGFLVSRLDYSVIWRYSSWSNRTPATIGLWACSVYLAGEGRDWKITAVPAVFMSAVTVTYFFRADECLGLLWKALSVDSRIYSALSCLIGAAAAAAFLVLFIRYTRRTPGNRLRKPDL